MIMIASDPQKLPLLWRRIRVRATDERLFLVDDELSGRPETARSSGCESRQRMIMNSMHGVISGQTARRPGGLMGGSGSSVFTVGFEAGRTATAARVEDADDLPGALGTLGLTGPRPVVVMVGGAGGMTDADTDRLASVLADAVIPAISASRAAVIDGGTDAGIMRMMGRARTGFPLIGVAAEGTVLLPGRPAGRGDAAPLESHHSHFLLVPGDTWGDESPWLATTATLLAGGSPSVTVLVNGGKIAFDDVTESLTAGRPVLVLDGTGRTADLIAAARNGDRTDEQANRLADSAEVHIAPVSDLDAVRTLLAERLRPRP
jgi:hypothetical protein